MRVSARLDVRGRWFLPRELLFRGTRLQSLMASTERDLDLVLITGAGASYDLGASGMKIAAMKEWSDRLTGALIDPGSSLLVGLQFGLDGMEFERRLGVFLASARAFRDACDLMISSADLTY